jgi:hypothetical protein
MNRVARDGVRPIPIDVMKLNAFVLVISGE